MAMAGFYNRPFPGSPDNVCCFMCNKNLDGWEPSDEAWPEHVKHASHCPLVRLDIEGSRLSTFTVDNWPHFYNPSLSADKMARAGFFFWPKLVSSKSNCDDTSVCFQCGLALDGWDTDDDPRHEHAKRRPECPYVRSNVAIRPCSFEFLLASKPDQNAVRHISARPQPTDKKFQMPAASKKPVKVPRAEIMGEDGKMSETRKASIMPRVNEIRKASITPRVNEGRKTSIAPVVNEGRKRSIAPVGNDSKRATVVSESREASIATVASKDVKSSSLVASKDVQLPSSSVASEDIKLSSLAVASKDVKLSSSSVTRDDRNTSITPTASAIKRVSTAPLVNKASVAPSVVELTPKKSRNSVVKKPKVSADSVLLAGFESIMAVTDLDKTLESFLGHLISSKLSQYDKKAERLLTQLTSEAIKDF